MNEEESHDLDLELEDKELNERIKREFKEIKDKYKERKAEIEKECLSQEYKDNLAKIVEKKYNELQARRKKAKIIISIIVLFATALLIATSK